MPLIKCEECLGQVSDQAFECPHCGVPLRERPEPKKKVGLGEVASFIFILVIAFLVWRAISSDEAAPLTAGVEGVFRPSQILVDSSHEIDEGEYVHHSFELLTDARVQVVVNSRPETIDVMLMTPAGFERYRIAVEEGGPFTYLEALSEKKVHKFDQTEILSEGKWTIVVTRPIEDRGAPKSTFMTIAITVY